MEKYKYRKWFLLLEAITLMIIGDIAIIYNQGSFIFLVAVVVGVLGMEIYRIKA